MDKYKKDLKELLKSILGGLIVFGALYLIADKLY